MNWAKPLKIKVKLLLTNIKDTFDGTSFASSKDESLKFENVIKIQQPFIDQQFLENKKHNLRVATNKLNQIIIYPNETLSFWKVIGNPNQKNIYKSGRSLVAGSLQEQIGGGLCQLSGAIFHLALISGLEIAERHQHSVDIYTDETRYTPLGTDATVVYGYKDLRIKNNFDFPIYYKFAVEEDFLYCELYSAKEITPIDLSFDYSKDVTSQSVSIFGNQKLITTSKYLN